MISVYLTAALAPLVGAIVAGFFGRQIGRVNSHRITIIGVAVSSMKRRGGMGVNLAFGIAVAFLYIFMDKVFGTLAQQSGFSPLLAVIIPNVIFGLIGIYLLQQAKR